MLLNLLVVCCLYLALPILARQPATRGYSPSGPRIFVPTPTYSHDTPADALIQAFHRSLSMMLGRSPQSTYQIQPLMSGDTSHLESLRQQLDDNRMQPMAFIGRTHDFRSKVYAYPIEQTVAANEIFGSGRPRHLRWAILSVPTAGPQRIELVTYVQTREVDLLHVRWILSQRMGSWGTSLIEALRRPPTLRAPV